METFAVAICAVIGLTIFFVFICGVYWTGHKHGSLEAAQQNKDPTLLNDDDDPDWWRKGMSPPQDRY